MFSSAMEPPNLHGWRLEQKSGKVLPALRVQGLAALRGDQGNDGTIAAGGEDAADLRDGDAGDGFGQPRGGRGGEEKFVVFSTVEGLGEGRGGVDGQEGGVDFSGDGGFFAEVGEVG